MREASLSKSAKLLQAFETRTARAQERLQVGPSSSRGVRSAPFPALSPMAATKRAGGCAGGASRR
eukprot:13927877-Alexandrium_andersonii.AAC.1